MKSLTNIGRDGADSLTNIREYIAQRSRKDRSHNLEDFASAVDEDVGDRSNDVDRRIDNGLARFDESFD